MRIHPLLLAISLALPFIAHADESMLRVTCSGADVGAEVSINGKFKGECPIDIKATPGTINIRVVKQTDAAHERVFEQDIRVGDGVVKKVEAILSAPQLTVEGQRLEEQRLAAERTEEQKREEARLAAERAEAAKRLAEEQAEAIRRKAAEEKLAADLPRLRAEFDAKIKAGTLKASFRDCDDCPTMVAIPPGSFDMGSNNGAPDELPVHRVFIGKGFAMGKTEVTQAEYRAIMGNNPSQFSGLFSCGDSCPVENVSWDDALAYINKLNEKTGKHYRLPSEAEWEYACRAGGKHEYCGSDNADSVAWSNSNSSNITHPVAQKQANAFGLFDMSGNVWEWVQDNYSNYKYTPTDGSASLGSGTKVLRGGSWNDAATLVRAAFRHSLDPAYRYSFFGFRLARTLP